MRILIVDTVYPGYLAWLHARHPDLNGKDYNSQLAMTAAGGFQNATTYGKHLRKLGHEVLEVWANHESLQARWCIENNQPDLLRSVADKHMLGPLTFALPRVEPWYLPVVAAQIKSFRPDILLSANLHRFGSEFLGAVRAWYGKAVGRHASALPGHDVRRYDLILSSLPNQVAHFRAQGIRADYLAHAFDEDLAAWVQAGPPARDFAFIGSLTAHHEDRRRLLREISQAVPIDIFSGDIRAGDVGPKARLHPPVWGLEMYRAIAESRIVLNTHLDDAGAYANNIRLYEVPGLGALQLTDRKVNLAEIFAIDNEVAVYDDPASCSAAALKLLDDEPRRAAIAAAGHRRVCKDHTLRARSDELHGMLMAL
jgi:hypothetical protein